MELWKQLQGGNTIEIWFAGLIWTIIGISLVKLYYYKKNYKFNLKYWLNDNIKDVALGLLISLVLLRMGNFGLRIFEKVFSYKLGEVKDFVAFMLFASIFIQYQLHKRRKPISKEVETEMLQSNSKAI